jgi:hypothetical protein
VQNEERPGIYEFMSDLDDLRLNGRQHIFLYRLKKGSEHRRYLRSLREKNFIEERLGNLNGINFCNKNHLKWDHDIPVLAEVKHKWRRNTGHLIFKWVETRTWGKSPQVEERSVNFFRLA